MSLLFFLVLSIASAGYFIFFRTVFAQGLSQTLAKHGIFFEEPDPPKINSLPVATSGQHKNPKIAIIIDDMGYDLRIGEEMLRLPMEITYSFLPFAPHTKDLERKAFIAGKTIFLHLPLEPQDHRWDPGPGALLVRDSKPVLQSKFAQSLLAVPHAIGVNNHMGSLFTENEAVMEVIMGQIADRSLIFVDSVTSNKSVGGKVAREYQVKLATRQVFLDNDLDQTKISHQLEKLIALAEKNGEAVGIGHPHQETVNALEAFVGKKNQTVVFVPIAVIAR